MLFPDISYSFYPVYCKLYQIPYHQIPLNNHLRLSTVIIINQILVLFFPNPNAPTGMCVSLEMIEDILKHNLESDCGY